MPVESLRLAANGIELYALADGPADGPLVMLLHGFPEFSYGWRQQIPVLAEAVFRVVAPDQRGDARSDRPTGIAAYTLDALADDVIELADALGRGGRPRLGRGRRLAPRRPQSGADHPRGDPQCAAPGDTAPVCAGASEPGAEELVRRLLPAALLARAGAQRKRLLGVAPGAPAHIAARHLHRRGFPPLPRSVGAARRAD